MDVQDVKIGDVFEYTDIDAGTRIMITSPPRYYFGDDVYRCGVEHLNGQYEYYRSTSFYIGDANADVPFDLMYVDHFPPVKPKKILHRHVFNKKDDE